MTGTELPRGPAHPKSVAKARSPLQGGENVIEIAGGEYAQRHRLSHAKRQLLLAGVQPGMSQGMPPLLDFAQAVRDLELRDDWPCGSDAYVRIGPRGLWQSDSSSRRDRSFHGTRRGVLCNHEH